jgi:hypothetical protein
MPPNAVAIDEADARELVGWILELAPANPPAAAPVNWIRHAQHWARCCSDGALPLIIPIDPIGRESPVPTPGRAGARAVARRPRLRWSHCNRHDRRLGRDR